jgi:hypothetical protein
VVVAHPRISLVFKEVAKKFSSFLGGGNTFGSLPGTLLISVSLPSSSLIVYDGLSGLVDLVLLN